MSSATGSAMVVARSAAPSCATDAFDEVEEPGPDEQEPEEAAPSRSIADLLVQDGDTWGSADAEGTHAII
jgi:hypothetical protein